MTADAQPTGPVITPASLDAAVQQLLTTATVPDEHGFAALADLNGVHAGVAARSGSGWVFSASGGYDWRGTQRGWQAGVKIAKTWA